MNLHSPMKDEMISHYEQINKEGEDILQLKSGKPSHDDPLEVPNSNFSKLILEFVSSRVSHQVLFHNLRMYLYSITVLRNRFPDWELDSQVLFTTCLLHNIPVPIKENQHIGDTRSFITTNKSTQNLRAFISYDLIFRLTDGNRDLAETVADAIAETADDTINESNIPSLSFILRISENLDLFRIDNSFINQDTFNTINQIFPRNGWKGCLNNYTLKDSKI